MSALATRSGAYEQVGTVLESGDIDVIRIPLDLSPRELQCRRAVLSTDEQAEADRFRFRVHRERFIARRGSLRELLAGYTGRDPADLTFSTGPHGKPELSQEDPSLGIRFSVSSSGGFGLCAVTIGRAVGIDIERIRDDMEAHEIDQLAAHFFSSHERALLQARRGAERVGAFFSCWTLKEAFIKARGEGLSRPLDQFDVDPTRSPSALLSTAWDPAEARNWVLRPVAGPTGYAAAVAIAANPSPSPAATKPRS